MDDVLGLLGTAAIWHGLRRLVADAPAGVAALVLAGGAALIWWRSRRSPRR